MEEVVSKVKIGYRPIGEKVDKGDVWYVSRDSMDKAISAAHRVRKNGWYSDVREVVERADPFGFLRRLDDEEKKSACISPQSIGSSVYGYEIKKGINPDELDGDENAVILALSLLNGKVLEEYVEKANELSVRGRRIQGMC